MVLDFCSYNIRGLNSKIDFVKDFISHNKLSLLAILETHVKKEFSNRISATICPNWNWVFNYDYHNNGRVWVGWDPSIWHVTPKNGSAQHLSCQVTHISSDATFAVSFVYAYNNAVDRRDLWTELTNFGTSLLTTDNNYGLPWVLSGDFNVILNPNDSSTDCTTWSYAMIEFQEFLSNLGLTDLRAHGHHFTWWNCNSSCPKYRKLDRIIVNGEWLQNFPMSMANFMARGLSDHSPAAVTIGLKHTCIKKPFQLFHYMLADPKFLTIVKEAWSRPVLGDPWYIVTMKLKWVKEGLKKLNKDSGNVHVAVIEARQALITFQDALPISPDSSQLQEENYLCNKLRDALSKEEDFLKQKSRIKWLEKGDGNNNFFYNSCKGHWNKNKILSLDDSLGNTHTTHEDISQIVVNHYANLLGSCVPVESIPEDISLPMLTADQQTFLEKHFTDADVLNVLSKMGKNKSPGPDGFTPEFFISTWSIIGKDVTKGILHFFNSLEMPRIVNSTAIALVPKIDNPTNVNHYRPISCCNTLYKCVSKLLADRIRVVLPSLISPSQSAFVPQRSIGDNIMLAQSICRNYHLSSGKPRCTLKLDIHKAFDSISWSFLFDALNKMGFPQIFIKWLKACIQSAMISIKVNGALEGYFKARSGLRQGDPISPSLFVIAMEVFSSILQKVTSSQHFAYHWRTKPVGLTHLIFADDMLLFCNADHDSINTIWAGTSTFSAISGLKANVDKSQWFFANTSREIMDTTVSLTGIKVGSLPIKYLGLPLITNKLSAADCVPLVHRICHKIETWTCRFLRFAGRAQLLRVVIFGIQSFWAMYLFLPKKVLKQIISLAAKFLWGGKLSGTCHYKVSWKQCCLGKHEGGLGIKDPLEWNKAAILYQTWRLSQPNSSSLWTKWVHNSLFRSKPFWTANYPSACPWSVRKLLNVRDEVASHLHYHIGKHSTFLMWHEPWVNNKPLLKTYSSDVISIMEGSYKDMIAKYITDGVWTLPPTNHVDAMDIRHSISSISLHDQDSVRWDNQPPEVTKLSTVWNSVRRPLPAPPWVMALWHPYHIPNCSFFLWLALLDRLLTKERMRHLRMQSDEACIICKNGIENPSHLFVECPFAATILKESPVPLNHDWNDFLEGRFTAMSCPKLKLHWSYLYIAVAVYKVWQERNYRLHNSGKAHNVQHVIFDIKRTVREKLYSCSSFRKLIRRNASLITSLY